jgi:hypothetical protein
MPTQWETFPVKFEGGLISNLGRLEHGIQAPGSATILKNFEPSVLGGYSKIQGYNKFSDTAVPGDADIQIVSVIVADSNKVLICKDNKYYTSTGTAWTLQSTVAGAAITKIRHDYYNFDGTPKIILVDGINDPAVYSTLDNSITFDTAAPSDVTGASIVKVFKNHVFFAKNNLLSFTAPYAPTDFDTGNGAGVINIGAEITGLVVFREQLFVFAVDRIMCITGNTSESFVMQPVADKTGCLIHESIQEVGGDIIYLGPDGVRYLSATVKNNDFSLERVSTNITKEINTFIRSNVDFASTVVRGKSQYRLFSFSSSTPRQNTLSYLATKYIDQSAEGVSWSSLSGIKVYSIDSKQFLDNEVILFSSDTNYVYRMESGNSFDGTDIECVFETPFMPITDPRVRKTLYKHTLYTSINGLFHLDFGIKIDYRGAGIIQPPTITLDSNAGTAAVYGDPTSIYGVVRYSTPNKENFISNVVGSGFTFAIRYTEKSSNPSFNLDYVILEYKNNERR